MIFWLLIGVLVAGMLVLMVNHDAGEIAGFGTQDAGQFLHLAIFGVLVAASMFGLYRGRIGAGIKHAVTWLLLGAIVLAVYSFRNDFQVIGARILSEVVPGYPRSTGVDNEIALSRGQNGHFVARANVNGTPVNLLVDTGASLVVLSDRDGAALGYAPDRLRYTTEVYTANGRARAAPITLDEINIGQIRVRQVAALVAQPGQLSASLLGMSFLDRLQSLTVNGDILIMRAQSGH